MEDSGVTRRVCVREGRELLVSWVTENCTWHSLGCREGGHHEPRFRYVKSEIFGYLSDETKQAFMSVWESDLGWFHKGRSPQHRDQD